MFSWFFHFSFQYFGRKIRKSTELIPVQEVMKFQLFKMVCSDINNGFQIIFREPFNRLVKECAIISKGMIMYLARFP